MRGWRASLTLGVALTGVATQGNARSQPPAPPRAGERAEPLVIALAAPEGSEAAARLVAELRFLGFSPRLTTPPADPDGLVDEVQAGRAAASIRLDAEHDRIEVRVFDRRTGSLVTREQAFGTDDPRELAVRAVELLRASLRDTAAEPEPEPGPAPAPGEPAPPPRLLVDAAVAVGGAPGGMPVLVHGRIGLRYAPHPRVGVVLRGTVPLHGFDLHEPEGSARIHLGWLGLGAWVRLRPPDAVVVPTLAATAGPALLSMDGRASPGLVGTTAWITDLAFEGAAGLEIAVAPRIRFQLEAAALTCAHTVRVRFAGRPVATWCRPHVLGTVGIGVVAW